MRRFHLFILTVFTIENSCDRLNITSKLKQSRARMFVDKLKSMLSVILYFLFNYAGESIPKNETDAYDRLFVESSRYVFQSCISLKMYKVNKYIYRPPKKHWMKAFHRSIIGFWRSVRVKV
jgi:hypothetical protein